MTKSSDSSKKVVTVVSVEKTQHGVCFIFVRFSIRREQSVISYSGRFTASGHLHELIKRCEIENRVDGVGRSTLKVT